jgi:hypothetical protein
MGLMNPSIRHASYTLPQVRIGDGKAERNKKDLNKPYVVKTMAVVGKPIIEPFCEALCIRIARRSGQPLASIKTRLILGETILYKHDGKPYSCRLMLQS